MNRERVGELASRQKTLFDTMLTRRRAVHLLGSTGLGTLASPCILADAAELSTPQPPATPGNVATRLFADDFSNGFRTDGPDADWFYFAIPGPDGGFAFTGNDGTEATSEDGLHVVAPGTHPQTGEPAFTKTVPQEHGVPTAVPGGVDHVKWLAYTNRLAATNLPGYDATPGSELVFSARVSGQTFGTDGHPFGSAVLDPEDDLRLASFALNTIDLETLMVFDIFLTNTGIYAFYERLPLARATLGNYAAFSYQIPIGTRQPDEWHDLSIAYDCDAGMVRWSVDGEERFQVDRIGHYIDRTYLTIDHGGDEETIMPRQLNGGMGMFTLLDGYLPSEQALVRLSDADDFYFDPTVGQPQPQSFLDEESSERSRLFGQGAELRLGSFMVESRSTGR